MNIPESAIKWILGGDTGTSSKTMFSALTGQVAPGSRMDCFRGQDIPHDFGDFGRCFRLILMVPEWKDRLHEVAIAFPAWTPVIREWDRLAAIYLSGNDHNGYAIWEPIQEESRKLDGWIQTSSSSWRRDDNE